MIKSRVDAIKDYKTSKMHLNDDKNVKWEEEENY